MATKKKASATKSGQKPKEFDAQGEIVGINERLDIIIQQLDALKQLFMPEKKR